jgi:ABC-type multidrug transport system fused ATPase/permease subunit
VIPHYERQVAAHTARRDLEIVRSIRISRLRLATVIPGVALLAVAGARTFSPAALIAGLALLLIFVVLVVWHAKVDQRVAWHDALRTVNLHALARVGRAWDHLPPAEDPPPEIEHHPYAQDLDLFGRASLLQWLGPAATAAGARTLQQWVLAAAPAPGIADRQRAVAELAAAVEWRESFAAHGRLTAGVRRAELEVFLSWAESAGPFDRSTTTRLRLAVLAITAAIWTLIVLQAAGLAEAAYWLIPVVIGMILSFVTALHVHRDFNRALVVDQAFARYADLFAHAVHAPREAPLLGAIRTRLAPSGSEAPECLRRLNRILGFAQLRAGAAIFHFPIQALTLWDFHVFFALDRWKRRFGPSVRGWMEAIGELDALSALAQVKADNPAWSLPEVVDARQDEGQQLVASDLGHPLIPDDRRVGNDVAVGPPGTILLITGSNMSGKSTLLRAIGLNAVLAQAGGPVCATALRMLTVDIETSIRVHDSLEHGLSYFMAALARLKGVLDRARNRDDGRVVLYLLDEILQGTNTGERAIAVRGVARHLLEAGAIGVMTTHDLGLAAEEPLNTAARLAHFTELVDGHGGMTFDYRLRPGLATSRNALRLMRLIGIGEAGGQTRL